MRNTNRWLIYSALAVHLMGYGLWRYTWTAFFYQAAAIQAIILSTLIVNLIRDTNRVYDRWLMKGACMWLGWSGIILLKECCVFDVVNAVLDLDPTKHHAHEYLLAFNVVVVCLIGLRRIRIVYEAISTHIQILVVFLCVITLLSYHFLLTRLHGKR